MRQNLSLSSTKTSSVADETNLVVDDVFTPDPSRLIPSTAGEVIAENNTKRNMTFRNIILKYMILKTYRNLSNQNI